MKPFYIYLTFDIDQDFSLETSDYYNRNRADFEGYVQGLQLIISKLGGLPYSVFLRADNQINHIYGRYDYLISEFPQVTDAIIKSNGEINWHIHIYKNMNGSWVQVRDEDEAAKSFERDFIEVSKITKINSNIVRVGECFMNTSIMECMQRNGIKVDSTALPGRVRNDKEKYFDWKETTNKAYFPSRADYRVSGEDCYSVLEVPMTTVNIKTSYDFESYRRYVNLSFKSKYLFQNLREYVIGSNFLVTITHPFEILSKGKHGLISYDIDVLEENLQLLIQLVKSVGKDPVFKRIGDIANEKRTGDIF